MRTHGKSQGHKHIYAKLECELTETGHLKKHISPLEMDTACVWVELCSIGVTGFSTSTAGSQKETWKDLFCLSAFSTGLGGNRHPNLPDLGTRYESSAFVTQIISGGMGHRAAAVCLCCLCMQVQEEIGVGPARCECQDAKSSDSSQSMPRGQLLNSLLDGCLLDGCEYLIQKMQGGLMLQIKIWFCIYLILLKRAADWIPSSDRNPGIRGQRIGPGCNFRFHLSESALPG